MSSKHALIVWGGWAGHTPKESAAVFESELKSEGWSVTVSDTMDSYADESLMSDVDLIVPIWTMGEIAKEQFKGLSQAVYGGVGLAGFHGGMIDSFRNNTEYQWMTGAQWVAHPGNCEPTYEVRVTDLNHEITKGIDAFKLPDTEQYYCHFDPGNHTLCETTFEYDKAGAGYQGKYKLGTVSPYAWTRGWGEGRVFGACWGHTHKDFDVPEAREIVKRGMLWAAK